MTPDQIALIAITAIASVLSWTVHEVVKLGKQQATLVQSVLDVVNRVNGHDGLYSDVSAIKSDVSYIRGKLSGDNN